MTEAIIVAVLALIGTLGESWAGVRQSNKMVCFRLEKLEEKVNKHNCLVEFYGGAFTCALTALNSRTAYNFITKRLSTGSAWTKFRRPIYY